MKKTLSILIVIILFTSCGIPKETKNEAREFNDKLVRYTIKVTTEMNNLFKLTSPLINNAITGNIDTSKIIEFNNQIKNINSDIEISRDSVNALTEFDNEIKLKKSALNYLTESENNLDNEYYKLVSLLREKIAQDQIIESGELILKIWGNLISLEKSTKEVQNKFAEKYSIDLPRESQNWTQIEKQYLSYKNQIEQLKNQ